MKKIAIFGGTFDPIHNGHLHIAYEALYKLNLDEIIFVPAGIPPHKTKRKLASSIFRYEMVKMATRNEKRFTVSDYEINKKDISYTFETLKHFTTKCPNASWYFITGADGLMDIENWKNVREIFKLCNLVVFNRPGNNKYDIIFQKGKLEEKYKGNIIFLDIPLLDISSTNIRKLISEGRNISYFVPEGVYNTIKELKLYD